MEGLSVKLEEVSKFYKQYTHRKDRLKEALSIRGRKYHKLFAALNKVSLEVKKGEIIGIVGRNGSGKTTLLKIIAGIISPSVGRVEREGKISALFNFGGGLNSDFTGVENIKFICYMLGLTDEEIKEKMPLIIEFSELGDFIYQPVKIYSSGMKARLGFSIYSNINPDILILDEVLAVGDQLFKRKSLAKMMEFFESGKTIFFVSHSPNQVNNICTRAVLLHNGSLLMEGETKEITTFYQRLIFAKPALQEEMIAELNEKGSVKTETMDKLTGVARIEQKYVPMEISEIKLSGSKEQGGNVFLYGDRVNLDFSVEFREEHQKISIGFNIRDTKNNLVSSKRFFLKDYSNNGDISPGNRLDISINFDAAIKPEIYYINIDIECLRDNAISKLALVQDAAVFSILNEGVGRFNGIVNLFSMNEMKITS